MSFWKDRNVFVTGATGFVGANLTAKLVASGSRLVCLQRDAVQPNSLETLGVSSSVTLVPGSVDDLLAMERILNEYEIDTVFHLAAQAIVGAANRSPISTFESNIRGTYMLLEACRRIEAVKRIVVASSDKAYGSHDVLPYREDFALNASFPYDVSKTCTDLISQSFAKTFDLPVSITRSANIYGPGDLNLSRIIPGTIVSVLRNEPPIIRSDGTPVREFVHVDDVARGYMTLAEKIESSAGKAYNFGSNEPVQMLDLVNRIIKAGGKKATLEPVIMLKDKIEREIDAQYLSADRMNVEMDWRAEIDLDARLASTIEWYQANLSKLT
ncbi:MAG TPA: NAD-dependent epimerase/dehydratase family protein [Pyrinomonadaceae bacterium]|nr:NAD-dependent epimerase/dehydratase family protein [Pyrinomonadaceae bacterium]